MTKAEQDNRELNRKVETLNRLHSEIQRDKAGRAHGFLLEPGSILNAYREGDLPFTEAVDLLEVKGSRKNAEDVNREYFERMRRDKEAEKRERLRDEFAMAALTGLLTSCIDAYESLDGDEGRCAAWYASQDAYAYADAMLAAREGK